MTCQLKLTKPFLFSILFIYCLLSEASIAAPAPPSNASIKKVTDNIVILSWQAASNVTAPAGYEIYRDGILQKNISGDISGYVDSGLSSQSYFYQVYAVDDAGSRSTPVSTVADLSNGTGIKFRIKALLQGAYDSNTESMKSDLRINQQIPNNEPYSQLGHAIISDSTLNPDLLTVEGADAIVDWILIELRDKNDPTNILSSIAALIQQDGDLVQPLTGSNTFVMPDLTADDYYIAIRHRNHLGIMSGSAVALSSTASLIDFSNASTPVWGENSRLISGTKALMWAGDVNHDGKLIASGPENDVNYIVSDVLLAPANTGFNANYIVTNYGNSDINLDGHTIFAGNANDENIIRGNVLLNPNNTSFSNNYIMEEQLP